MENFEGLATEHSISQNCVCKVFKLPSAYGVINVYVIDCSKKKILTFV